MTDRTERVLRLVQRAARRRPERELQTAILRVLQLHRVLAWGVQRERAGRARASHIGFTGLPDITGVLPGGRALFLEVKRPNNKATPQQERAMYLLHCQGAVVSIVRSVEDAQNLLVALGLRRKPC